MKKPFLFCLILLLPAMAEAQEGGKEIINPYPSAAAPANEDWRTRSGLEESADDGTAEFDAAFAKAIQAPAPAVEKPARKLAKEAMPQPKEKVEQPPQPPKQEMVDPRIPKLEEELRAKDAMIEDLVTQVNQSSTALAQREGQLAEVKKRQTALLAELAVKGRTINFYMGLVVLAFFALMILFYITQEGFMKRSVEKMNKAVVLNTLQDVLPNVIMEIDNVQLRGKVMCILKELNIVSPQVKVDQLLDEPPESEEVTPPNGTPTPWGVSSEPPEEVAVEPSPDTQPATPASLNPPPPEKGLPTPEVPPATDEFAQGRLSDSGPPSNVPMSGRPSAPEFNLESSSREATLTGITPPEVADPAADEATPT